MKWLFTFLTVLAFMGISAENLTAQNTVSYEIINHPKVDDLAPYHQALNSGAVDRYRQAYARTSMKFSSGVVVELLSGEELIEKGVQVDLSRYFNTDENIAANSVFSVHESSGKLLEMKMAPQPVKVKKTK